MALERDICFVFINLDTTNHGKGMLKVKTLKEDLNLVLRSTCTAVCCTHKHLPKVVCYGCLSGFSKYISLISNFKSQMHMSLRLSPLSSFKKCSMEQCDKAVI